MISIVVDLPYTYKTAEATNTIIFPSTQTIASKKDYAKKYV